MQPNGAARVPTAKISGSVAIEIATAIIFVGNGVPRRCAVTAIHRKVAIRRNVENDSHSAEIEDSFDSEVRYEGPTNPHSSFAGARSLVEACRRSLIVGFRAPVELYGGFLGR